jgi:hypothetical protein
LVDSEQRIGAAPARRKLMASTSSGSGRSVTVLALIVVWNIISTAVHYTHNFVHAEHYPPVEPFFPSALSYKIGIAFWWPILTAVGVWALMCYRSGHTRGVPAALLAYSLLGFLTIFHFLGGVPDIPAFFMITIFTDFIGGLLLIAFAAWLIRTTRVPHPPPANSRGPATPAKEEPSC